MAAFQRILHLIVLSGFVLPGLSLSSSPSATPQRSPPSAQRLHVTDQRQSEFPRKLESEIIAGLGPYSGKAEVEDVEFDGETEGGKPVDGPSDLNAERESPVEQVDNGHRRLVEGSKGQRWVKGKLVGNDVTVWGKTTDLSTELLRKDTNDGETRRTEAEKEKRKWGENSMRVWGKRTGSGTESRNWGENSVWDQRAPTATDKRKWGDNSMSVWGKRSEDGNEKRKWGDNSMSVWGKRSDSDKRISGHTSTSGKANEAAGVDNENRGVTRMPKWVKQEKVDLAKDTGSSQAHRILHKRSIFDREENAVDRPRYDWLVQELSKRSRPRLSSRGKQYGGPKRNWETNTMKVWGKRGLVLDTVPNWDDYLDEESKPVDGKRTWTSDNAIRVWGKRNSQLEANEILGLPMYDQ